MPFDANGSRRQHMRGTRFCQSWHPVGSAEGARSWLLARTTRARSRQPVVTRDLGGGRCFIYHPPRTVFQLATNQSAALREKAVAKYRIAGPGVSFSSVSRSLICENAKLDRTVLDNVAKKIFSDLFMLSNGVRIIVASQSGSIARTVWLAT